MSLNDAFWIRKLGDSLSWSDVNLYTNAFSPELEGILLSGHSVDNVENDFRSPDFTMDGRMRKSWMRDKRGTFLVKSDMREGILSQSMCEWFAAQAAECFGIAHVPYSLRSFGKEKYLASECPLFTSENVGFVKASHFFFYRGIQRESLNFQSLGNIALQKTLSILYGKKFYEDMMIFDFLIGNIDRHLGNYGWLVNNHTGKLLHVAPLFDHGKSFFSDEPHLPQDVEDWIRNEAQISTFLQPEEQLSFLQARHEEGILRLREWEPKQHPDFCLSDTELDTLVRFVRHQCAYALTCLRA